MANFLNQWGNE
ncbi:hypothetical protein LB419_30325 [Klebsiella pneumoniae]|nr:hypothetical protein [Klebsiella pneumoniae]